MKLIFRRHKGADGKDDGQVDVSVEGWQPGRVETFDSFAFEALKQASKRLGIEMFDDDLEADLARNAAEAAAADTPPA